MNTLDGTYALLTRASTADVVQALDVPAWVGRMDGWTVAALDPALITDQWPDPTPDRISSHTGEAVVAVWDGGETVGLAASRDGDTEPMMFSTGYLPPTGLIRGRLWLRGWTAAAQELAERAGVSGRGTALGEVRQPAPDGSSIPVTVLLDRAIAALGLPPAIRGTSVHDPSRLEDAIRVDPPQM